MKSSFLCKSRRLAMQWSSVGLAVLVVSSPVWVAGCGPSQDEAKQTSALERIRNMPKPGFFRLINLGTEDLAVTHHGRQLSAPVKPGAVCSMSPVGVGKQPILLKGSATDRTVQISFVSKEGITYIALPDGKSSAVVEHEPLQKTEAGNLHVVFLTETGAPILTGAKATVMVDGVPTPLSAEKPLISLSPATITADGPEFDGSSRASVDDQLGFTALFIKSSNGKFKPFLLQNASPAKPATGGMSST